MTLQSEVLSTFNQIYTSNSIYGQSLIFEPASLQIGDVASLPYNLGYDNYYSNTTGGLTTTYSYSSDYTGYVSEQVFNQFENQGVNGYFNERLSLGFNLDPSTLEVFGINYGFYEQNSDNSGRVISDSSGSVSISEGYSGAFYSLNQYYYLDSSSLRIEYSTSTSINESIYDFNNSTYTETFETTYTYDYGTLDDSEIIDNFSYATRYGVGTNSSNDDITYTKDTDRNANYQSVTVDSITGVVKNASYNLNSNSLGGVYSYSSAFTSDYDGDGLIDNYYTTNSRSTSSGASLSNSTSLLDNDSDGIADFVSIDIRQSSPLGGKGILLSYSGGTSADITLAFDINGNGDYDVSRTKLIPVPSGLQYSMPTDHVVDLVDVVGPTLI